MNDFSVAHLIIVLIIFGPLIWASIRILHRMGFSGWWVVCALIPLGNIVGLVVLASVRWPVEGDRVVDSF